MTREEIINGLKCAIDLLEQEHTKEETLKHEHIIDKIRAEIAGLHLIGYATVDGKRELASRAVMQIIDKYRTERSEKE